MDNKDNTPEIGEELQYEECAECTCKLNLIDCDICGDYICESCIKTNSLGESGCQDCVQESEQEGEQDD